MKKQTKQKRKLTLNERIEWCTKQDYFDPFDFGIGKYSKDKKHAELICDEYGAPKYFENDCG